MNMLSRRAAPLAGAKIAGHIDEKGVESRASVIGGR